MTVSNLTARNSYSGNGSATVFDYDFPIQDESYLQVTRRDVLGNESTLVLGADYTVTGVGNEAGGTVVMTLAPASGEGLTIIPNIPATQETEYTENDNFPAKANERALDKLTMLVQQLQEELRRCVRLPVTDADTLSTTLPTSAIRANQFAAYDADGNPTVVASTVAGTPVSSLVSNLLNLNYRYNLHQEMGLEGVTPNYVNNPIFDIVQGAGIVSAPSDNAYVTSGWRALLEASSAATFSSVTSSLISFTDANTNTPQFVRAKLRTTIGSSNNNKFGVFQVLESAITARLRTFINSLQCYVSGDSSINQVCMSLLYWTGAADSGLSADPISAWNGDGTNPTLAAGWNYAATPVFDSPALANRILRQENISVPQTATNLAILIWVNDKVTTTGHNMDISNVKLELGKYCSEFTKPPISQDLLACQRAYEAVSGASRMIGAGQVLTSTTARIVVPMKATKRITPTLAISNAAHFSVFDSSGSLVACTGVTLNATYSTADIAVLDITVASGLTAGAATQLVTNNASALLELSARL